ncbi:uncharacterized protein K460DRAFT_365746 [Cucurbitaria berberidis CBS 394.84]|uniref:Uncharacterized protein n=1 Tax=Cucurbitaria berberidis CBS 394.84 TaxID=1168544 RepID=A0A9P4GGE3_9PLEO|nr:uncharacterized protein K460DRAFT_365746 [Cucurbitaria berberidis CBS 394.84]KAF1844781.1 hypothetical protein K460DRAFT_365746 [Cucurbitaria berberidis CBS 394.84]
MSHHGGKHQASCVSLSSARSLGPVLASSSGGTPAARFAHRLSPPASSLHLCMPCRPAI